MQEGNKTAVQIIEAIKYNLIIFENIQIKKIKKRNLSVVLIVFLPINMLSFIAL